MQVHLLVRGEYSEGYAVISAHATRELAEAAMVEYTNTHKVYSCDYVSIETFEVQS